MATTRRLLMGLLALGFVPCGVGAQNAEEILGYHVDITVQPHGALRVTESITVRALGLEIRRGIYRDFPTGFPRESGLGRIEAPFSVVRVLKDGTVEPYRLESIGGPLGRGGIRVRIGDPDVFLSSGDYRYELTYDTDRWLRFGETDDQLYWNVTGNGWAFPIREASATVTFPGTGGPDGARLEAWTGPEGSTASDASWTWDAELRQAVFTTTRTLAPGEGLTLRVTLPTGVIDPPTPEQQAEWFRLDWGGYIDGAIVAGLVLAFYLLMWTRVGRDPPKRSVVARYEPPAGFSPAALGYLGRRGYEDRQLTATLVSLAVQGAVRIEKDGHRWTLERTGVEPATLTPDERAVLAKVVPGTAKLTLSRSPESHVRKAAKELRTRLKRQLETVYFVTNRRWFLAGLGFTAALFAALTWRARFAIAPEGWFLGLWLTFWTLGVATLLVRVTGEWRRAFSGELLAWPGAIFLSLFSLPFVGAEVFVGTLLLTRVPHHLPAAGVILGILNAVFYHLLERPTLKGRGVLDDLAGFRRFLEAADADRLDRLHPPERTPELFERFLPHAIALDVENRWADSFGDTLSAVSEAGVTGTGSTPAWYSGGSGRFSASSLASSLGSSLSSSLSASSASPSSGGGGGGGGSSGGGGGGGGGGGW